VRGLAIACLLAAGCGKDPVPLTFTEGTYALTLGDALDTTLQCDYAADGIATGLGLTVELTRLEEGRYRFAVQEAYDPGFGTPATWAFDLEAFDSYDDPGGRGETTWAVLDGADCRFDGKATFYQVYPDAGFHGRFVLRLEPREGESCRASLPADYLSASEPYEWCSRSFSFAAERS
jgi:hypothetical protein